MRRIVFSILISIVSIVVFSEVVIKDVSPQISEYEAIIYLVKNGIMELENGKFNGSEYVSRFEIAKYLYNLVRFLQSPKNTFESATNINRLNDVYDLLRYDPSKKDFLRLESLEEKDRKIEKSIFSMENRLEELTRVSSENSLKLGMVENDIRNIYREINDLRKSVDNKLKDIKSRIFSVDEKYLKEIENLKEDISSNSSMITVIGGEVAQLDSRIKELENKLNRVEGFIMKSSNEDYIDSLEAKVADLSGEIDDIKSTLSDIKKSLGEKVGAVPGSKPFLYVLTHEDLITAPKTTLEGTTVVLKTTLSATELEKLKEEILSTLEASLAGIVTAVPTTVETPTKDIVEEIMKIVDEKLKTLKDELKKEISEELESEASDTIVEMKSEIDTLRSVFLTGFIIIFVLAMISFSF
jgi:TolA-binding protein